MNSNFLRKRVTQQNKPHHRVASVSFDTTEYGNSLRTIRFVAPNPEVIIKKHRSPSQDQPRHALPVNPGTITLRRKAA